MDVVEGVKEGEVSEVKVWGTFRGNEWSNKGEVVEVRDVKGVNWFAVRALGPKEYIMERPGCQYIPLKTSIHLLVDVLISNAYLLTLFLQSNPWISSNHQ